MINDCMRWVRTLSIDFCEYFKFLTVQNYQKQRSLKHDILKKIAV